MYAMAGKCQWMEQLMMHIRTGDIREVMQKTQPRLASARVEPYHHFLSGGALIPTL